MAELPPVREDVASILAVANFQSLLELNNLAVVDLPAFLTKPGGILEGQTVELETRAIVLPLGGNLDIIVVKTEPGFDYVMDVIERSIRTIEEFMAYPFPTRHAIYLVVPGGGGAHYGSHVFMGASSDVSQTTITVVHETAHYYWGGGGAWRYGWLGEGAAEFMVYIGQHPRPPLDGPLQSRSSGECKRARTIASLEELPERTFGPEDCNYALGEAIYRDLYRNMDEKSFRQAFRRLSLLSRFGNTQLSPINMLKDAFYSYVSDTSRNTVEDLITRRYEGPPPDNPFPGEVSPYWVEGGRTVHGVITGLDTLLEGSWHIRTDPWPHNQIFSYSQDDFEIYLPPGTYTLVVECYYDNGDLPDRWWFDDKGGVTTDQSQAMTITIDNADVEGLDLLWPGHQCTVPAN